MRRLLMLAAGAVLAVCSAIPANASAGWTVQPTPSPPVALSDGLSAVSCASAGSCAAVGNYDTTAGNEFGLAEHWNGSKWAVQSNPSGNHASLNGVACPSATRCVAVGSGSSSGSDSILLAESWNGTKWTAMAVPAPPGMTNGSLSAVACPSASDCFAAGTYNVSGGAQQVVIEKWNGTAWAAQAVPSRPGSMSGIACQSASSCFAVGTDGDTSLVLVEHWNGTSWIVQGTAALPGNPVPGTPDPVDANLSGVSCTATDCTAAGFVDYNTDSGVPDGQFTLAEQWNGRKWVFQNTTDSGAAEDQYADALSAVSCTSSTHCTAVGAWLEHDEGGFGLISMTWNGVKWASQNINAPDSGFGHLTGVACATACTAVGNYENSDDSEVALAERN